MRKSLLSFLFVTAFTVPAYAEGIINNDVNALLLQMKARSLVGQRTSTSSLVGRRYQTGSSPLSQSDRLRNRRGGPHAYSQDTGCGGVSIGNVYPIVGDHRAHQTTIIIQGNILNTGNKC